MLHNSDMRRIRRETFRPDSMFDHELAELAKKATVAGHPNFEMIQKQPTQAIYRYLSNFVGTLARKHFNSPDKKIKILDWGGGKGYITYFLQNMGFDVTLYETSNFQNGDDVWTAFDLNVKTSNKPELPFADKSFDIIVGAGVLEHVPYDYEALKELNRVLKDDGLFVCFNLPNRFGYLHSVANHRGVKYHDRLYSVRETNTLLKRAGFNTVGRAWRRQLFPKNQIEYRWPLLWERFDLFLCNYTPLSLFATSIEFVARKQYAYTTDH